jgi:MYXO-CTERM domain-containing protein
VTEHDRDAAATALAGIGAAILTARRRSDLTPVWIALVHGCMDTGGA